MNVTFACPKCDATSRVEFSAESTEVACDFCHHRLAFPSGAVDGESVKKCLICPCEELFVRKNFSQRLGVAIIVAGFAAATVAWYYHLRYVWIGILFGTALLDVVLYAFVGNLLQCYRCHSEYRGVAGLDEHGAFSLETHERYRQQTIRLREAEAAAKRATSLNAQPQAPAFTAEKPAPPTGR